MYIRRSKAFENDRQYFIGRYIVDWLINDLQNHCLACSCSIWNIWFQSSSCVSLDCMIILGSKIYFEESLGDSVFFFLGGKWSFVRVGEFSLRESFCMIIENPLLTKLHELECMNGARKLEEKKFFFATFSVILWIRKTVPLYRIKVRVYYKNL